MISALFLWWVILLALGWLAWPLTALLFPRSPGKGYAYARVIGLLALAYAFWLPGVLGLLPNTLPALLGVAGLLVVGSLLAWRRMGRELFATLRREWRHALVGEGLFLALFVLCAWHRSHDPAIQHTEQPMDFAFLNALIRSPHLPPDDPWLAGFRVSYYYLGYLTVALMTRLAGLSAGVGYNLGLAQTAALAALVAYGVLYDLWRRAERPDSRLTGLFAGLGGLVLILAGNLEGIFEGLKSAGVGPEALYRWLGVPGLQETTTTGHWIPQDSWWWWHASRIIEDANFLGRTPTVITEFPAFSLILGDLHPHLMALPFGLLAVGLAAELYRRGQAGMGRWWREPGLWLMPLFFGALGFVNSWDLPTFALLGVLALLGGVWVARRTSWRELLPALAFVGWLGAGSILLYLPFYWTLTSQAQGIGLAYYAKTPLRLYWLHFGVWLWPILVVTVADVRQMARESVLRVTRRGALALWVGVLALPWALTLALGSPGRLLLGVGVSLLAGPWLLLFLSALLAAVALTIWRDIRRGADVHLFPRLLILLGLGLTYVTEFFYLRDMFDTRMNTIFKVYYQAWALLALGALWAVGRLWRAGGWQRGALIGSAVLLAASLYYPVAAGHSKAGGYRAQATLDGTAFLADESPDEYGAYRWLQEHAGPNDVLLEGVGEDYYASHNRLSAWTGIPTVLGWPGHEAQWRGSDDLVAERIPDVAAIYTSTDPQVLRGLLAEYGVTYIYVGPYERDKYGIDAARLEWYAAFCETAYAAGDVRIYRVPR
jgi:YYY domain-containing protein